MAADNAMKDKRSSSGEWDAVADPPERLRRKLRRVDRRIVEKCLELERDLTSAERAVKDLADDDDSKLQICIKAFKKTPYPRRV